MKKTAYWIAILAMPALLATAPVFADSSGNFTAVGTSAACVATPATFNSATGTFEGETLSGGTSLMSFTTSIQTPNGLGTTLLIRPSLDTGLFTATKLSTTVTNATADVGVMVCVYVDPTLDTGGAVIDPGLKVNPSNCVVYDQRIQQVSNTLFGNLLSCVSPAPGVAAPGCNFEILLTTLSAHSFDFVVPMPGNGDHKILIEWALIGENNNTLGGETAACVGPVSVTVQQVKNFSNGKKISFTTN